MRFSIIIPTRARVSNIQRILASLNLTLEQPNKTEVILRLDDDDGEVLEACKKINTKYKLKKVVKPRNEDFLSDLWEDCRERAVGSRFMMCADDVVFKTKNWDAIVAQGTPNPEKLFHFVYGNDKIHGKGLATLPIVSRAWVETVGYFVPRGYTCDYCDTHLQDIAIRLNKLGCNVIQYFDNVVFEHRHPVAGKAKWDKTYSFRRKKHDKAVREYNHRAVERAKKAERLAKIAKKIDSRWRN
jgi:hypothetical protein